MRTLVLCTLLAAAAQAQDYEFEAVSVKPNKTISNSESSHGSRGQFVATNVSLKFLIMAAYGIREYQVIGPEWLAGEHYDVAAKYPPNMPTTRAEEAEAQRVMLQKMLAHQFKLATHKDKKEFGVFALQVGKGGIKSKEVPNTGSHTNVDNGHYNGKSVTMSVFADFLSRNLDRPVIDMTELKGAYDFEFDFIPERRAANSDNPGPTLATVIQDKLGLRLDPRKAPLDVIVIDHVEKTPVE
jgi:uncharacterized protein (TIGR03435 family)